MGDLFDDLYDIVRGTHIDLMDMGAYRKAKGGSNQSRNACYNAKHRASSCFVYLRNHEQRLIQFLIPHARIRR